MYKVTNNRVKSKYNMYLFLFILLVISTIGLTTYAIISKRYELFVPLVFIVIVLIYCAHVLARLSMDLDTIKDLEKNGLLVKNLVYDIGRYVVSRSNGGHTKFYYAFIKYQFGDGDERIYKTPATRFPMELINNKTIDLLYDKNDHSKYYFGFNIQEVGDNNARKK